MYSAYRGNQLCTRVCSWVRFGITNLAALSLQGILRTQHRQVGKFNECYSIHCSRPLVKHSFISHYPCTNQRKRIMLPPEVSHKSLCIRLAYHLISGSKTYGCLTNILNQYFHLLLPLCCVYYSSVASGGPGSRLAGV